MTAGAGDDGHPRPATSAQFAHSAKPKTLRPEAKAQVKQLEPEMADIGGLLRDARAALKKAKRVDYYALLEVDTCADETEIKKVGLCKCLLP